MASPNRVGRKENSSSVSRPSSRVRIRLSLGAGSLRSPASKRSRNEMGASSSLSNQARSSRRPSIRRRTRTPLGAGSRCSSLARSRTAPSRSVKTWLTPVRSTTGLPCPFPLVPGIDCPASRFDSGNARSRKCSTASREARATVTRAPVSASSSIVAWRFVGSARSTVISLLTRNTGTASCRRSTASGSDRATSRSITSSDSSTNGMWSDSESAQQSCSWVSTPIESSTSPSRRPPTR